MSRDTLLAHLAGGITTVCRAWAVTRRDGVVLGFTDHDRDLNFDGITFRADSGVSARAISQTTGLSVDNSEAQGALTGAGVTEADILAGRFDGAEVRCWQVNWADPAARALEFAGTLGELRRAGGAFWAELRGLSEALNREIGLVYHAQCSAALGDARCGVDLDAVAYRAEAAIGAVEDAVAFDLPGLGDYADRWFERGRLRVLDGAAAGLWAMIKNDRLQETGRRVELWQAIPAPIAAGDRVRIEAGCDKRAKTCRIKFDNFLNFRGFPHVPGEDWLMSYPVRSGKNDGGSRTADDG